MMKDKRCSKCRELKPFKEFYRNKREKYGLQSRCKECMNEKDKAHRKTKEGLITKIYASQRMSSRKRNYPSPNYTVEQLRQWAFNQPIFHELYDEWCASGYKKELVPSFDRKDDYKSYTFDNLQVMTWAENYKKAKEDQLNGVNNKMSRAVIGININTGACIEFPSQHIASRSLVIAHTSISNCCLGKQKSAGGYHWINKF